MKVGLYIPDNRPELGGGYTYGVDVVSALASASARSQHEIVAIGWNPGPSSGWTGPYVSLLGQAPSRVAAKAGRAIKRFIDVDLSAPRVDRTDRVLGAQGIDLIWAGSGGTPTRNLPYVATVLDLQHRIQPHFPEVSSGREWDARERFYAAEIGRATRVIVGNEAGRREVQAFYGIPDERIRKLPHPTPSFALDAPTSSPGQHLPDGLEPGYVFYPAQFWPHKNHVAILEALQRLRADHGLRLDAVFVGSDRGNEQHVRKMTRDLALEEQVHFLGFVPRPVLVALYRNALAIAYMSYFGPENLPPLEAFALGCPVIASRVAGSDEQLGDAAILVDPTDHAGLAAAFQSLLGDAAMRQQLVAKGAARARAFTPGDYAAGMLSIIDELEPIVRTWR